MPSPDIESIVERSCALWREASGHARQSGIELYVKLSDRVRAERGETLGNPSFQRVSEAGVAIRTITEVSDEAGFAAASGFSSAVVGWVAARAQTDTVRVSAACPDHTAEVAAERWDLDPLEPLPSHAELAAALGRTASITWVEAGTTTEVLVGIGGWFAVRRRQRVWSLATDRAALLHAQRRIAGWENVLTDPEDEPKSDLSFEPMGCESVVLLPEAAAPIVMELVGAFHRSDSPNPPIGGDGWTLTDDPLRADGLTGGAFDDAGFPSVPRSLAIEGRTTGSISGPGTFRRASFRDRPEPAPSNLSVPAAPATEASGGCAYARRSRMIRLKPDVWVVELELVSASQLRSLRLGRVHARLHPRQLLEGCAKRIGSPRVTAYGPVVPSLLFTQIPLVFPT